jgi:1-acyl-sn-glycerol-3-phosphate acyltransferase
LFLSALSLLIATALLPPTLIVLSFFTPPGVALALARAWGWIAAKGMGLTFSRKGLENVVPEASYIITPNHQSNADILALLALLPMKFRWVVKRELLKIPLFGWALARTGAVALNRKDRSQSVSRLQQAAESKLQDGWSILIYPEGTRSMDGNLQEFKKGAFMMAVQTGIPILPVICNGAFKVLPQKTIFVRPGHITLTFGEPIETQGLTIDDIPQLMEKTRHEMNKHFDPDYDPFNSHKIH